MLKYLSPAEVLLASRKETKTVVGFDQAAADLLLAYPWPGNLRELPGRPHRRRIEPGEIIPTDAIFLAPLDPSSAPDGDLSIRAVGRRHIGDVLARLGDKRQAARVLGLSRSTLDRKLTQ